MTCVDGSHIGGSEHIHQEEGGWLGEELQHRGEPLGWQLSSLPVHHKSCYSHKIGTQHPYMPFELWLKSRHVLILSVHDKKDGAQHLYNRLMGLCTQNEP